MTRAEANGARFLLVISPQLLASAAAIAVFTYAFKLPSQLPRLHLVTIAAVQCVFFLICGLASRAPAIRDHRLTPYVYATALFVKFLALNLLYLASLATNFAWGDHLSRANLRVVLPHLQGFREAFGIWIFLAVAVLLLLLAGLYLWMLRSGPRHYRSLRAAFPDAGRRWTQPAFAALVCLAAAESWGFENDPVRLIRADPVVSFWLNKSALTPAMYSDLSARRAYPVNPEFRRRNVIVFSIDCMRADHLSFYGYARPTTPYLTSLLESGRLQKGPFAVSVGNNSTFGIFGILASRHVENQHAQNFKLYDVLKLLGYRTYMISAGDHTAFEDMRPLYGPNFDLFSDGLAPRSFSVNDDRGILETLEKIPAADSRPAFFFFHLMSAHSLAVRDPRFALWPAAPDATDRKHRPFTNTPERARASYDAGLRQADDFIKRILALLEQKGYLHDYVGVITGDHGDGLGERGNYGHTRFLYMEDICVPILFLDSQTPPPLAAQFASQVDIAPTLLDRLGLPLPASWEGLPLGLPDRPRLVFLTGKRNGPWRGVIRHDGPSNYKYLFVEERGGNFRELLFDLTNDPHENRDVLAIAPPALLQEFRRAAADHFQIALPTP